MEQKENKEICATHIARIAVYDDMLSAPRITDVQPCETAQYIEQIASQTYTLAQQQGSVIPYTVIREVAENFIHAQFQEPTVSILNHGNLIRFADQGPGIEDKQHAQLPGFTSATSEMKPYIRGVGSGLPIVKEYLRFQNGRLVIEDNIKTGTVITITVENEQATPQVQTYIQQPQYTEAKPAVQITDRERDILKLAQRLQQIGPTEVSNNLYISAATAHRALSKLEAAGLLTTNPASRKRVLTDRGAETIK